MLGKQELTLQHHQFHWYRVVKWYCTRYAYTNMCFVNVASHIGALNTLIDYYVNTVYFSIIIVRTDFMLFLVVIQLK